MASVAALQCVGQGRMPIASSCCPTRLLAAVFVEASIAIFYVLLSIADALCRFVMTVYGALTTLQAISDSPVSERRDLAKEQPTVAIIGASFGGLRAARALDGKAAVTLIDSKDFFEYTPGILRCLVRPSHLRSLTCKIPERVHRSVLTADVLEVCTGPVELRIGTPSGATSSLSDFDYLIVSTGSEYAGPVKPVCQGLPRLERTLEVRELVSCCPATHVSSETNHIRRHRTSLLASKPPPADIPVLRTSYS